MGDPKPSPEPTTAEVPKTPERVLTRLRDFTVQAFRSLADGTLNEEQVKQGLSTLLRESFDGISPADAKTSPEVSQMIDNLASYTTVDSENPKYQKADIAAGHFLRESAPHLGRYIFEDYSRNTYDLKFFQEIVDSALRDYHSEPSIHDEPFPIFKIPDLK